jgi:hypothetical protein
MRSPVVRKTHHHPSLVIPKIEGDDGEFDYTDAPYVDEDIGECDLVRISQREARRWNK